MQNAGYVLLVDDDNDDVEIFGEILHAVSPGLKLRSANNGIAALNFLEAHINNLPALIFMDLNMPRMDGRDCLKKIKANPALSQLPVIIYTTSSNPKDIAETTAAGATGFITKPCFTKDLYQMLSLILSAEPAGLAQVLQKIRIALKSA